MTTPLFSLDGCVGVVTGAGRGMGRGVAETLARQGATVAVNDFYAERAESVAAELRAQGCKALAAPADVTDYDAVKAMIAKVREQAGIVDIYVSNAGVPTSGMGYAKFLESTPADWERFVKLNMYGLMNGAHAVLPGMLEKGWGRIVAITSESWRAGVPMGIAAYAASKAGVVGFIRQLAAETGRKNITVNALSLGTMNNWEGSDELATRIGFVPRAGSPADVGAGVVYLASREASWVTGQVYPLNGGALTA